MAEISIGEAVGEGFALIRRRFGAVMTWGVVQVGVGALLLVLVAPYYLPFMAETLRNARTGAAAPADVQRMIQGESLSQLINLVSLFVNAVISCAVFRAVLHPEQGRFAYLRVGGPELSLFVLIIAGVLALMFGLVAAAIPIGVVAVALVKAHAGAVAAVVGLVGAIAAVVGVVYLALRVSLVGPMMVDDGKFHLTEAWTLTRGKVASLLGLALLLLVLVMACELVVGLVVLGVGFGALGSVAGGLRNLPSLFQQPPAAVLGKLAPILVGLAAIWVPLAGCLLAILGAPWARAYRDLRPARDIAETFA
jgi:hypothetical protein